MAQYIALFVCRKPRIQHVFQWARTHGWVVLINPSILKKCSTVINKTRTTEILLTMNFNAYQIFNRLNELNITT